MTGREKGPSEIAKQDSIRRDCKIVERVCFMAGRKSTFTPETQALILKYFQETGNLKNSAIRAGMSERSFFAGWRVAKMLSPVPSGASCKRLNARVRTGSRRLPFGTVRGMLGGVIGMPVYDLSNRLVCDQTGRPRPSVNL